tara:strand:- start:251 stop:655 length:405 start_codon:yes stop_codon:yes gene_type:complete
MGKTRETANLTAENLVSTNITSDFLNVGTAITMYGGSTGIISATAFYGDGSNLTGISGGGGGGASEAFKTISVSGQSDVVADSATDTLTLVAGSNMTITTNASGDSITFASSGGGGGGGGITRAQSMISAMVFS